jgi:hypothetical protein
VNVRHIGSGTTDGNGQHAPITVADLSATADEHDIDTAQAIQVEGVGMVVVMVLSSDAAAAALASYDPTSSTSPSAADSRRVARTVLDALAAAAGSV